MADELSTETPTPEVEAAPAVAEAEIAPVVAAVEESAPAPKVRKPRVAKPVALPEVEAPAPIVAKAAAAKPAKAVKAAKVAARPAPAKPVLVKRKAAAPRVAKPSFKTPSKAPTGAKPTFVSEIFPMTTDLTDTIKTAFAEAQGKAKAAYETGTAKLGEVSAIAKDNAEAVVESSKILAEGLQKLGTAAVADSREAFEGLTAEIKEMVAVKSPTDFFKLQGEFMRKQFDSAIAYGTKHTEAMTKLSTEAMAPISRRVAVAMESIKTGA